MKTSLIKLITLSIVFLLFSCGPSVTVTDAWKAPNVNETVSDKFLVMARLDDLTGRQRFEDEISNAMRDRGIDAIESYKKYPQLNLNVEISNEELNNLVEKFRNDGIEGIVLTVLKDIKTEIRTTQTGGYYPSMYGGYGGFGGYYGRYYSPYGMSGHYTSSSQRTYNSDTYKLETVVYELKREPHKQLVAVVSVNITNPKSANEVAPKYADKVLSQFD